MSDVKQGKLFADLPAETQPQDGYIIRVAIEDSGVDGEYDYLVGEKHWPILPGCVVEVPFGRGNNSKRAFCLLSDIPREDKSIRLKKVKSVIEKQPLLNENLIELAKWISAYYVCPIGQTISAMVPSAVKKGIGIQTKKYIYLAETIENFPTAPKQKAILEILTEHKAIDGENGIEQSQLLAMAQCTAAVLKSLQNKSLVKTHLKKELRTLPALPGSLTTQPPEKITLNEHQSQAIEYINSSIDSNQFGVSVLHGVTDSGKTEVYIRAIQHAVNNGKTAIILLPEIALTAQTVQRFQKRFENVAVMHSGLSAAQRNAQWQSIKSGTSSVVIGARSAIFAPLENLGLIVVDEEHEPSYKQDTAPRYHGRDVAVKRAHLANAHCILGSATPSLESLYNCNTKKPYKLLPMPNRVNDYPTPRIKLVDLKLTKGFNDPAAASLISEPLKQSLDNILAKKEQAILLLNRRGYSNYVFCPSCKHTLHCRNCDVSLTFHRSSRLKGSKMDMFKTVTGKHNHTGYAICHYCMSRTLVPEKCPFCSTKMIMIGLGSQRLEEELAAKFPNAISARIDSDSMQSKDYYKLLEDFGSGKIDILAGTQMLAKGLHFPNVTLVGVISADTALTLPDFRANERTFQLIRQVSGRAGRSEKGGSVILQTFFADQPVIDFALRDDFEGFVKEELKHRQLCDLPPTGRLAIIHIRDEKFDRLESESANISNNVHQGVNYLNLDLKIRGPMPSSISRIHGFYRNQIIIQAKSPEPIQRLFAYLRACDKLNSRSKIAVDIDPVNLL